MSTNPTPPTTHLVREVEEGTINPRYRCTCGWQITTYYAADAAMRHVDQAAREEAHKANAWMDPGDGTLLPVEVLGRSLWPGSWRVRTQDGTVTSTSRLVGNNGAIYQGEA